MNQRTTTLRDELADEWIGRVFPHEEELEGTIRRALKNAFNAGWIARKVAVDYAIEERAGDNNNND